jgi:hypothetical protein
MSMTGACALCSRLLRVGSAMKKERIKDRISEREYHDRLKSLLNDFNTQLEPLKSLKTATKKLKKKA